MSKRTGLTLKQLKYVENRAKGLNKTDSARVAGFSEATANVATLIEQKPHVAQAIAAQDPIATFQEALKKKIDDSRIADKLSTLMDAQRLTKLGHEDDNQAQLKATELVMRAQSYLSSDKGDTNIQVNIQNVLD